MHTYSKTHLRNNGGNIHYCMDKISGINASLLLYCSNIYISYMSKSETIRNQLLVINRLIEKLETPID